MGVFAEIANVRLPLSFSDQGKQTSVSRDIEGLTLLLSVNRFLFDLFGWDTHLKGSTQQKRNRVEIYVK
jgi:hypothetical protein